MPPGLQALRRLIALLGLFGLLRDDRDYAERAGFDPRRPTSSCRSCFALRLSVRFAKRIERESAARRVASFGGFARRPWPPLVPYSS